MFLNFELRAKYICVGKRNHLSDVHMTSHKKIFSISTSVGIKYVMNCGCLTAKRVSFSWR